MYEEKIAVVQAIRRAFPKFQHYKEYSARVKPYLQAELPNYTISVTVVKHPWGVTNFNLKVWGKGIPFDNSVYLTWSDMVDSKPVTWQEGLLRALQVADMSDYAERHEQEQQLIPLLTELDQQVQRARERALAAINELPVPSRATVRSADHFWSKPSHELREQFPLLFKDLEHNR